MTTTEIISDAVKIGLGAIVGGVFSIIVLWRTHRHEIATERARRKQDSLEQIVREFEAIHARLGNSSVMYCAEVQTQQEMGQLPPELNRHHERSLQLKDSLLEVSVIEGKLLLLDLNNAAARAREYGIHAAQLLGEMRVSGPFPEIKRIHESMKGCALIRQEFYESLKAAYLDTDSRR